MIIKLIAFITATSEISSVFASTQHKVSLEDSKVPIVQTKNGPVMGEYVIAREISADKVINRIPQPINRYLGIPFAQPPVGPLRFKPPQPVVKNWSEPLMATRRPNDCVSNSYGNEDCLYLNVFVPAAKSDSSRAVMIWIHGGNYKFGSISEYDGTAMAATEDVILVMGNYRLGVLGFFANDATFAESGTTGNWGLMDQQAVMLWVKDNISAFGGDPNRVTLFGESAGAMSTMVHLGIPTSSALFSNAIIQSGGSKMDIFYQPLEDAKKFNHWFATKHLPCPNADMDCLRRVDSSHFHFADSERNGPDAPSWGSAIYPLLPSGPVIDGTFLKGSPYDVLGTATGAKKTVIIGITQDEGSIFVRAMQTCVRPETHYPPLPDELRSIVFYLTQDTQVTDRVMQEYPKYVSEYKEEKARRAEFQFLSNFIRDVVFACPAVNLADTLTKAGHKVFVYNFAYDFWSQYESRLGTYIGESDRGAFHGSEIDYVFGMEFKTLSMSKGNSRHVSDFMSCLWANIAHCHSPECKVCKTGGAGWKQYDPEHPSFLLIDADGKFRIDTIPNTGDMPVRHSFPPKDTCTWYMQNINTPFRDLGSSVTEDALVAANASNPPKAGQIHTVCIIFAVSMVLLL